MKVRNYNTLPPGIVPSSIKLESSTVPEDNSEMARLLKLVYAPDKRTGLPSSDISILASDSVPAEVAQWVRTQLLNPMPDNSVSSVVQNTQMDDDTILSLVRNVGEDDRAYIDRVDGLLREWNKKNEES